MPGAMQCSGCGSSNVSFDPQRRVLQCNQCGKQEYYSRATLNANGKVLFCRENAVSFFTAGNVDAAYQNAMDIINVSKDNATALYIIAYYDERTRGKNNSLKTFFDKMLPIALEYEEVMELIQLFLASPYQLMEYEKQVLVLIARNLQDAQDAQTLCGFVDKLCPYLIRNRTSSSFLDEEMTGIYAELAEHCGIPRTCYALLTAIRNNPDSPYTGNTSREKDTFFLKVKTEYFYSNFVRNVGRVISAMQPCENKEKFQAAFEMLRAQLAKDAKR